MQMETMDSDYYFEQQLAAQVAVWLILFTGFFPRGTGYFPRFPGFFPREKTGEFEGKIRCYHIPTHGQLRAFQHITQSRTSSQEPVLNSTL